MESPIVSANAFAAVDARPPRSCRIGVYRCGCAHRERAAASCSSARMEPRGSTRVRAPGLRRHAVRSRVPDEALRRHTRAAVGRRRATGARRTAGDHRARVERGRPHAAITARMLLAHTSGMNSGADYRTILDDNVERFALARELVASPGSRVIYSDLGFIVLGDIVSSVAGRDLAAAIARGVRVVDARISPARPDATRDSRDRRGRLARTRARSRSR